MNEPSPEQKAIMDAHLEPLCVIACAGSGKTYTAVRRVIEMCRKQGNTRCRVALLSFSNIAVDTFRDNFRKLTDSINDIRRRQVEIKTMDAFLTANILLPHAYRTMGCNKTPFLITGNEPFLENDKFKFWTTGKENFPISASKITISLDNNKQPSFYAQLEGKLLPIDNGKKTIEALGKVGAYTYDMGRYWSYRSLKKEPKLCRAIARRYPYILIDEAQDIGKLHQAILELLMQAGSQISLIGDPHQGIYEFAGADGEFLKNYGQKSSVKSFDLTCNYRSVPSILTLSNRISSRKDTTNRSVPETANGAYFFGYKDNDITSNEIVASFCAAIKRASLQEECSAIICRSTDLVNKLTGRGKDIGQGAVKNLALAAIQRDKHQDYNQAFETVANCIAKLIDKPPPKLARNIITPTSNKEILLRREIWKFIRNSDNGLPHATLQANTEWHQLLRQNVDKLLQRLSSEHNLPPSSNLGHRLSKKALSSQPLITPSSIKDKQKIRIDTVHQVKGEGLDAVLYLTKKEHVEALLNGTDIEIGRIGYVAVTRARDLFWLGVPSKALETFKPKLLEYGFQEISIS